MVLNSFEFEHRCIRPRAGETGVILFCAEDGVISGWKRFQGSTALSRILFDNSKSGAVYKGCALGGTSTAPLLFAANFNAGSVDVFDGTVNPVVNAKAFANSTIPAGFAPFNVQNMNGTLYVTYAKQDGMKHADVAGAGNGFLAMFDQSGNLLGNLLAQGPLNSPWGMAIAPATLPRTVGRRAPRGQFRRWNDQRF